MKEIKKLFMMLAVLTLGVLTTSCSKDDPTTEVNDFYIMCTSVSGGGLSSQDCSSLQNELNEDLIDITWKGMEKSEAIELFDELMKGLAREFSSERPATPIKIQFSLQTTAGTVVKKTTLTLNNEGCKIN